MSSLALVVAPLTVSAAPNAVKDNPSSISTSKDKKDKKDNEFELDEEIKFDDFTITITGLSLAKSYDGEDVLVVEYDWENTSDNTVMPMMTFSLKAFQDGVETHNNTHMVDGVDYGSELKEVRPGGKIKDCQTVVGIDDLSQPLELALSEFFSFMDDEEYILEIEDLSKLD